MKKKILSFMLAFCLIVTTMLTLTACKDTVEFEQLTEIEKNIVGTWEFDNFQIGYIRRSVGNPTTVTSYNNPQNWAEGTINSLVNDIGDYFSGITLIITDKKVNGKIRGEYIKNGNSQSFTCSVDGIRIYFENLIIYGIHYKNQIIDNPTKTDISSYIGFLALPTTLDFIYEIHTYSADGGDG